MSTSIPFSVATATDLGCITALRELSSETTVASKDEAKALIISYFNRQTEAHQNRGINAAESRFVRNGDEILRSLEQSIVKEGLSVFGYEFIEARRELELPPSTIFPRPEFPLPSNLSTQSRVWAALEAADKPNDTKSILQAYVDAKVQKGRTPTEIAAKLDLLEGKLLEHKIHRHSDAFIAFRSEQSLPPSTILDSSTFDPTRFAASAPSKGRLSMPVSFSTSTDPVINAQAAYQFLSRRAVDGYVESQSAVLSALEDGRTRREEGRASLLLQGFADHARRNGYSVEEKMDRLEKEMLARRLLNFSAEIHDTRLLLSLPPSQYLPFTPPPPPPPLDVASPPPPPHVDLSALPPVFRQVPSDSELPPYVKVGSGGQ